MATATKSRTSNATQLNLLSQQRTNGKANGRTHGKRNGAHNYDESKIKTLSSLEHIRMRTGMYIGRLGSGTDPDDGIYVLLKEVVDNACG